MCILNTHTLTGPFFQPVLRALYASGLSADQKKQINQQLWTTSLEDTIDMFSIPEETAEQMREAYRNIEVPNGIKTFGDEEYIRTLPGRKILVTSGYQKFQQTKINKLGIAPLFDQIIIDALDYRETRKGKRAIFADLLSANGWAPSEVLVVGDNPLSELGAAKALSIPTVQTLRPSIQYWDGADYHVHSLSELNGVLSP